MRIVVAVWLAAALPLVAAGQVVCGPGQVPCGTMCYSPSAGQTCAPAGAFGAPGSPGGGFFGVPPPPPVFLGPGLATVCGAGQVACGTQCFDPAAGQQCFPGGVVCGAGQTACGDQCISPASGQTCSFR